MFLAKEACLEILKLRGWQGTIVHSNISIDEGERHIDRNWECYPEAQLGFSTSFLYNSQALQTASAFLLP